LALALTGIGFAAAGCGGQRVKKPTLARLEHLITTGKLTEAEELCRQAMKSDPNDYEARGSLAHVLCLEGDAALAEAGFFVRAERGKKDKEPIGSPKYAAARKLFESALAEARQASGQNPKNARIHGTLGLALYRTGEARQAVEELKAALKDDPNSAEINNTLGLICYEAGKTGEALSYYQTALALDNTMPEVCYNLAVLYDDEFARTGRAEARGAALRYYQLFRQYSRGTRDADVQKAIGELEGKGAPGGGAKAGERQP
jgi:Flp pilus assembly protein TadD